MKATIHEVNDAKWAISEIFSDYGDKELLVSDVVAFMEEPPRKGAEADAVKRGAQVFESEFGAHVKIVTRSKRNPQKSSGRTVTFSDGRTVTFRKSGKKRSKSISKKVTIPAGKHKGDHFTKKGVHYTVVSYVNNGKRIRFARRI